GSTARRANAACARRGRLAHRKPIRQVTEAEARPGSELLDIFGREDVSVLEGAISVDAAIRGKSRDVHGVYMRDGKPPRAAPNLRRLAASAAVPVEFVPAAVIDRLTEGRTHGGIIAAVGPRRYLSIEEL